MNLTRASKELFRRTPDECYPSLSVLSRHCQYQQEQAREIWQPPTSLWARPVSTDRLGMTAGEDQTFQMNDWSFSQLCRLAGVSKIARVVEALARRPQMQERLTSEIADSLMTGLQPTGVAVVLEAEHLCMTMRGVKKPGSRLVTRKFRSSCRKKRARLEA